MLIKLENCDSHHTLIPEISISIDNMLRSFQEKKHILITDKSFFKSITTETLGLYNQNTKQIALEAMKGQAEYTALLKIINFYIIVDFNVIDNSTKWVDKGSTVTFIVGPIYFKDSSRLQYPNIIFENLTDNDFYQVIIGYFSKINRINKCNINCTPINGGGGTTKEVFDRYIQKNELILCLLDNDKKHPKGPLGSTSKAFGKAKFNKTGMVKILDVHEIESLIPIETIEKSTIINEERNKTIDFLKSSTIKDETIKFYFDHKKGLELKNAFELDKLHGAYWIPFLKSSNSVNKSECLDEGICTCKSPCMKIEGFGDNILGNAIDFIHKGNLHAYTPTLPPRLENQWSDIGRLLFSWCCGPYKKTRLT